MATPEALQAAFAFADTGEIRACADVIPATWVPCPGVSPARPRVRDNIASFTFWCLPQMAMA